MAKNDEQQKMWIGALLVGLLIGCFVTFVGMTLYGKQRVTQVPTSMHVMSDGQMMMNHDMNSEDSMSMDGMVEALQGKEGDEFDKAFLTLMIAHHQGAVDMAEQVLQYAKHPELKSFASDIISVQTDEINKMDGWLIDWGYEK